MRVEKIKANVAVGVISIFTAFPALAGGLADATNAVNEIKTWGYSFLGAVVFVFLIYKVVMAFLEKVQCISA